MDGLGSRLAATLDVDAPCLGGRKRLVLNLDFTSVELPGILCALNGLMRSISSASNSAVDFTVRAGAALDRNEGGPAAVAFVPFFLTFFAGLGLCGRAMD